MEEKLSGVRDKISRLGITVRYNGFEQTVCAVSIALAEPDSLTLVSKLVYPDVARRFGVSWRVVERNIRTVIGVAWEHNQQYLCELAGHELTRKPTASDFVAILANAVSK